MVSPKKQKTRGIKNWLEKGLDQERGGGKGSLIF